MSESKEAPTRVEWEQGGNENDSTTIPFFDNWDDRECVSFLLENPKSLRWQLERHLEVSYAPNVIKRVRDKGIHIICEMLPYTTRRGKEMKMGRYSIAPEYLEIARKSLGAWGGE